MVCSFQDFFLSVFSELNMSGQAECLRYLMIDSQRVCNFLPCCFGALYHEFQGCEGGE